MKRKGGCAAQLAEVNVRLLCTKIVPGTVSERPKVQLSKSCVGVEPTVGSNPTGSAKKQKRAPSWALFLFIGGTGGTQAMKSSFQAWPEWRKEARAWATKENTP